MNHDVLRTITDFVTQWQGRISIADAPDIASLVIQRHPEVDVKTAEVLIVGFILERALAAGGLRIE